MTGTVAAATTTISPSSPPAGSAGVSYRPSSCMTPTEDFVQLQAVCRRPSEGHLAPVHQTDLGDTNPVGLVRLHGHGPGRLGAPPHRRHTRSVSRQPHRYQAQRSSPWAPVISNLIT